MIKSLSSAPFTCFLLVALFAGRVEAAFPTVALKPVVLQQIHSPTNIVSAGDGSGRLFVCDQLGKIHIIQGGMLLPTPFLNIASTGNAAPNAGPGPVVTVNTGYSERGLLGLVFHPGFANPVSPGYRKFYINYNKNYQAGIDPPPPVADHTPNCTTVIAEFQVSAVNPNAADPASERRVLLFTQPQSNHNGGQLEFGPDGYLYLGTGDGGGSNDNNVGHTGGSAALPTNGLGNGQDKTRLLGKILRIDPLDPDGAGPLTYSIPATNPFVGAGGGVREEIYAFGLRNPWRFSFDKRSGGTNRLFCGDVGQGRIEEINLIVAGGNYGWRYKEGLEFPTFSSSNGANPMPDPGTGPYLDPIAMYGHSMPPNYSPPTGLPELGLSVTGGFVYRGTAIPALQGKYVFGDYGSTSTSSSWNSPLMGLEETAPNSGVFTLTQAIPLFGLANPIVGQRILCLGEDESGEIYVGMKTNAGVLALDPPTTGLPAGGIYKIVPLQSASKTITANKDNTIFSEDIDLSRSYSDGRGYVYAGETGSNFGPYHRRGLVSFDLTGQIPAGAIVQSAQLKLNLSKPGPESSGTSIKAHRLTQTWGEGTSVNVTGGYGAPATTNDATWLRRFYNTTSWTTPGGTFSATQSAAANVTGGGLMTWGSTSQLVSDVQGWLTTPASNAGWILIGDETTDRSACQFDSLQSGGTPPALQLTYNSAPPPTYFETWLATYFPANLTGQYVDPNGDLDGDSIKNQIEYAFGFSPLAFDEVSDFSVVPTPAAGNATDFTVTFRRDSAATDLNYQLQTSSDLITWTTIAQSNAGAAPAGQNGGVVVSDVALTGTVRLVTARQTLPAGANSKKFVRLQVDRF